jgi:hypothetical protein
MRFLRLLGDSLRWMALPIILLTIAYDLYKGQGLQVIGVVGVIFQSLVYTFCFTLLQYPLMRFTIQARDKIRAKSDKGTEL